MNRSPTDRPPVSPSDPWAEEILEAEILAEPELSPSPPPPSPPPPPPRASEPAASSQLTRLQAQLQQERQRDRRHLLTQLQDSEHRILGHLFNLYNQTDRLDRKLDRLLADRANSRSRQAGRSSLVLLGLLALGIAYIAVIQPAWRDRVVPGPRPTAPAAPSPPVPATPAARVPPGSGWPV